MLIEPASNVDDGTVILIRSKVSDVAFIPAEILTAPVFVKFPIEVQVFDPNDVMMTDPYHKSELVAAARIKPLVLEPVVVVCV